MKKTGKIYFARLNTSQRVQHIIFVVCFLVLAITGLMVKTPEEVVRVIGTAGEKVFFIRGILHRTAAVVFIVIGLYHILYMLFRPVGRRRLIAMIPKLGDFKDLVATYLYYLGIKDKPPRFGRFIYKHKFEHIFFIIGSIIMSVTGVMLWTGYRWSKFLLDVAIIVHGMQAILACLIITILLLYEVYLKPRKFPIDNMLSTGLMEDFNADERNGDSSNK